MKPVIDFVVAHQLAVYMGFSAIVSMLPTPLAGQRWYQFAYDVLHFGASNVAKVFPALRVGSKQ